MKIIVVRGANGVVGWTPQPLTRSKSVWTCTRDAFQVTGPDAPSEAEASAVAIVQHSAQLVGAISNIVQLDL
jgi:hypothetical protein